MSLPSDLKHLYAQWLEEFTAVLNPRQDQLASTYDKARRNLLDAESVIYYPQDLKKIKGIGDTIMRRLEKRLQQHCSELGVPVPVRPTASELQRGLKRTTTALRSNSAEGTTENVNQSGPAKKRQRKYIPKKRSGGYGILLALLQANAVTRGISKDSIVEIGQRYCDSSMGPNFMTKELRGAWSAVKSLIKHELVVEQGRPKIYFLTEEGQQLAKTLKLADKIVFENENEGGTEGFECNRDVDSEVTANLHQLLGIEGNTTVSRPEDASSSLINVTFQDPNATPVNKQSRISRSQTLAISTPVSRTIAGVRRAYSIEKPQNGESTLKRRFDGISYEVWHKGTYEVYPIIDHREVKSHQNRDFFAKALELKGIKCEIRQLALGDIVWIAKNTKTGTECILNTIIERKRLDDLAISIRDNRFMEQKNRLEKSGCKNKYYLIEETMARTMEGMTEALKTALWVILVYYRFSMIRTVNADETVEKLYALHTVINREYLEKNLVVIYPNDLRNQDDFLKVLEKFRLEFEKDHTIECCHTYPCFQEIMGKGEMSTVGELTIRILMYINGVSIEKAVAIQSHFPTLNHILTAYNECETEEEAKLLMFSKLGDAPGTKKITKGLSEKIADVFSMF